MAIKETIKLTRDEILEYMKPISREDLDKVSGEYLRDRIKKVLNERKNGIVSKAISRSEYSPNGYGVSDVIIYQEESGDFYAEWLRSDTCD